MANTVEADDGPQENHFVTRPQEKIKRPKPRQETRQDEDGKPKIILPNQNISLNKIERDWDYAASSCGAGAYFCTNWHEVRSLIVNPDELG